MMDSCNIHSPFRPIEAPLIQGGKSKKEMPKDVDALIEGCDISPKGTIEMLLDIIESRCPEFIEKELVPRYEVDKQGNEHEGVAINRRVKTHNALVFNCRSV